MIMSVSAKIWVLLALVGVSVVLASAGPSRSLRQTEREESNDVNSHRGIEERPSQGQSGQDTPAQPPIPTFDDEDEEDPNEGFFLSWNPFRHSMTDMFSEFRRMEAVMRTIQDRILNMTVSLPETYDNSTSEIIEINGRKFKLERTVIRRGDNDSSVFLSATSLVPVDKRRKREALAFSSMAEELHRKRRNAEKDDEDDDSGTEEDDG